MELFQEHHLLLQRMFEVGSKQSTGDTTCTTFTAVTVRDKSKNSIHHLLLVAGGHNQSITDYEWTGSNYSWRISTFHTKKYSISSIRKNLATLPCDVIEIGNSGRRADIPCFGLVRKFPEYVFGNIKLEFLDDKKICFKLTSSSNSDDVVDAVTGVFATTKV